MAQTPSREALLTAARAAAGTAYAPYSRFRVGAALAFADGAVITAANIENASYGLSLCAETVAVARAMAEGRRGGLLAVAVVGGFDTSAAENPPGVTPCGRCRQVLHELAALDDADPLVWTEAPGIAELRLSQLLPHAFGPASLGDCSTKKT